MASLRIGMLSLMAVCIILQVAACTTLALSGDKRYKTEVNNVLLNVQSDFDKDGATSPKTVQKLEKLLAKYQADYGSKGSYMRVKEMYDIIKKAETDPNNAFNLYREALAKKGEAEGYLTTEVKD